MPPVLERVAAHEAIDGIAHEPRFAGCAMNEKDSVPQGR